MRRFDSVLKTLVVASGNVNRTWAVWPDLLGHHKDGHKPSAIDRLGITKQLIAAVLK